jgi:hypothetical protein
MESKLCFQEQINDLGSKNNNPRISTGITDKGRGK